MQAGEKVAYPTMSDADELVQHTTIQTELKQATSLADDSNIVAVEEFFI